MQRLAADIFGDRADNFRLKAATVYFLLVALNIGAWAWALLAFHGHPVLLGTAVMAYGFGLRHAVDLDGA